MASGGGFRRSLAVGAFLGLLVVAVAVAAGLAGAGQLEWFGTSDPPRELLVVAVADDAEGAAVAGTVVRIASDGTYEAIDPFMDVEIPGTTYTALRDAYAFGGGGAVASAYAGADGAEESLEWVVLPQETWETLVDSAGGVGTDVPEDMNVFVNDKLFIVKQGEQVLGGAELAALMASQGGEDAVSSAPLNESVADALAGVLIESWGDVVDAVQSDLARSSLAAERLREFSPATE